ncbi:AAA family ATPase [Colwelliaceae bacterium BS250]
MNLFDLAKKKISAHASKIKGDESFSYANEKVGNESIISQKKVLELVDDSSINTFTETETETETVKVCLAEEASEVNNDIENIELRSQSGIQTQKFTPRNLTKNDTNHKSFDFTIVAPCPVELADTGLSEYLLLGLMLKHLHSSGVLTLRALAQKIALSGAIVQHLIDDAKNKSLIENHTSNANAQMRFSLSSLGVLAAEKEIYKNGYIGPAPVPLSQYSTICLKQSSRGHNVTQQELAQVFSKLTFPDELIAKVGPSLNSTKPILIYGDAGTGKSFFCRHLNLVFGDDVLIPHAIEVNNEIIQVFDPEIHETSATPQQENILKLATSYDPRWVLCKRPLVVTGGELTAEMLEVKFDPTTKTYRAPLQLKANNGILLLDDLGRQKISPKQLFNRWIVPLEERRDFLSLQSGLHFELPFELLLLFSTNLTPTELVDEAFLRRLGYKIQFEPMAKELYQEIWFKECVNNGLLAEMSIFEYLVDHLHQLHNRKYLPCYPRDLIAIINDQVKFKQLTPEITKELLNFAWHSYFVK